MKYRKKIIEIEAMQFSGKNDHEILSWASPTKGTGCSYTTISRNSKMIVIQMAEKTVKAFPGDWIIRSQNGDFSACKPFLFKEIYEPVSPVYPIKIHYLTPKRRKSEPNQGELALFAR